MTNKFCIGTREFSEILGIKLEALKQRLQRNKPAPNVDFIKIGGQRFFTEKFVKKELQRQVLAVK